MKKLFKIFRNGKWEDTWLDVEEVKDPDGNVSNFIEYTPPKNIIPPPMMGFIACLVGFLALALIIAALIICFT